MPMFVLGARYAERSDDDTAFGGSRRYRYALNIAALGPTAELLDADRQWVRDFWSALVPHAAGVGSYVNFMTEFEENRVRASYGDTKYERLSRIKGKYDPDNVFHFNANIRPAAG